jgi:hypothetical protein
MMGRREDGQGQFFYAFDLDKVVPPDHLVRQIDAVLDLSWIYKDLAPYYSHTGRPSIDPVLMMRMLSRRGRPLEPPPDPYPRRAFEVREAGSSSLGGAAHQRLSIRQYAIGSLPSQAMKTEKTNRESAPPAITSFSPARSGASSLRKCSPIGWPLTIVPRVLRRSCT